MKTIFTLLALSCSSLFAQEQQRTVDIQLDFLTTLGTLKLSGTEKPVLWPTKVDNFALSGAYRFPAIKVIGTISYNWLGDISHPPYKSGDIGLGVSYRPMKQSLWSPRVKLLVSTQIIGSKVVVNDVFDRQATTYYGSTSAPEDDELASGENAYYSTYDYLTWVVKKPFATQLGVGASLRGKRIELFGDVGVLYQMLKRQRINGTDTQNDDRSGEYFTTQGYYLYLNIGLAYRIPTKKKETAAAKK